MTVRIVTKECKWKVIYTYENDPRIRVQFFTRKKAAKKTLNNLLKSPVVNWAELSK